MNRIKVQILYCDMYRIKQSILSRILIPPLCFGALTTHNILTSDTILAWKQLKVYDFLAKSQ